MGAKSDTLLAIPFLQSDRIRSRKAQCFRFSLAKSGALRYYCVLCYLRNSTVSTPEIGCGEVLEWPNRAAC